MVKQYDDGYFINGEWVDGVYDGHDPSIVAEYISIEGISRVYNQQEPMLRVDIIDGPHLKPICVPVEHAYLPDNAWSTGNYAAIEEPCDVQYITYLFYAIAFLAVLAILFIIFA